MRQTYHANRGRNKYSSCCSCSCCSCSSCSSCSCSSSTSSSSINTSTCSSTSSSRSSGVTSSSSSNSSSSTSSISSSFTVILHSQLNRKFTVTKGLSKNRELLSWSIVFFEFLFLFSISSLGRLN